VAPYAVDLFDTSVTMHSTAHTISSHPEEDAMFFHFKRENSHAGAYLRSMVDVPEINQFHLLNKSATALEL